MRRMFKVVSGVALGLALMTQMTAARAEQPQDAAAIDKSMKAIGPAFGAARKAAEAGVMADVKASGATLSKAFGETEAFFKSHDKADGVEMAQGAKKAADALANAATAEAAKTAAGELTKTCAGCHAVYRTKAADGSVYLQAGPVGASRVRAPGSRALVLVRAGRSHRAALVTYRPAATFAPAPGRRLVQGPVTFGLATGSPASRDASANTSSYMAGVTFPVWVFCRDGWKQPTSVSPAGPPVPGGASRATAPCAKTGRGRGSGVLVRTNASQASHATLPRATTTRRWGRAATSAAKWPRHCSTS